MIYFAKQDWSATRSVRVFLAGPTQRSHSSASSWRPAMVEAFEKHPLPWDLLVPEAPGFKPPFGHSQDDYERQVEWEWDALNAADIVVFWVPRHLIELPGFTTNVEFGYVMATCPEDVVLGFPPGAPKTRYLAKLYKRGFPHRRPCWDIAGVVEETCNRLYDRDGDG